MGKTRQWLALLVSLVLLACSALIASATTLAGGSAAPIDERWDTAVASSSLLESGGPPEFGRCIKTTGGKYEDAGCTTTGTGKNYEWQPAFGGSLPLVKTGFTNTIKEGTTAELETVGGNMTSCSGESATGKYTGNQTVGSVIVTFTGCMAFGVGCKSAGAAPGTVVTNTLEGVLGVEELGAEPRLNKIGEELFPVGRSGPMSEFSCGGLQETISGAIISPVTSNLMKLTVTIKSKAVKGKQRPEHFVEQPAELLLAKIESGGPEQSGQTLTTQQTNEEKVEINSVL
jgi:hypothetical protein